MLLIPRFLFLIVFSGYDFKCLVYEKASIVKCTQTFIFSNPKLFTFCWILISLISSLILVFIVWCNQERLNYCQIKIHRKGSFWSLVVLLLITIVYYGFRIDSTTSDELSMELSVSLLFWSPITMLVVCCLNQVPRVRFPDLKLIWYVFLALLFRRRDVFNHIPGLCYDVLFLLVYWISLAVYCAENLCMLLAVMLDAAAEIAPVIEFEYHDTVQQFKAAVLIVLGLRVAFRGRLLLFFWSKVFHGDKDLFSEPTTRLEKNISEQAPEAPSQEHEEIPANEEARVI